MNCEQDGGGANRFGSWYKNGSWADITVCFKVRTTLANELNTSSPGSSSGTTFGLSLPSADGSLARSPTSPRGASSAARGIRDASALCREGTPVPASPRTECSQEDICPRAKRARIEPAIAAQHKSDVAAALKLAWVCELVDEFPAHRLVLGSMSDVFKVQFDNWDRQLGARVSIMLESREDLEAAHELMRFMYFERLSVPLDALTLIKVAHLADQYQVIACLHACSNALCGLLSGVALASMSASTPLCKSVSPSSSADSNAELLLAVIMLEEQVGTPLQQLQQKAVDILRSWFRDFDAAWNRDALRSLFLQLPRSYLGRLLHPSAFLGVASENSIATALHFWAQSQPPGTLTPELSTSLLRHLHFLGLTTSYLTVVLPSLPTFAASPELTRCVGEACRLQMSKARIDRSGRDRRDNRESRDTRDGLNLKVDDWQYIVARPLGLPQHFSRKRSLPSAFSHLKSPCVHTWTVPYSSIQALYASTLDGGSSTSATRAVPGSKRCRGIAELCSPPRWHQGLMFTTKLQLVPPTDKRPVTSSHPDGTSYSGGSAPHNYPNNHNHAHNPPHHQSHTEPHSHPVGAPTGHGSLTGGSHQRDGDRDGSADGAGRSIGRGNSSLAVQPPTNAGHVYPKLQCAVTVQVDPLLSESQVCCDMQFHLSYKFQVALSQGSSEKMDLVKTHIGALMPLGGKALWKPLWRISPPAMFDTRRTDGEMTVTTTILELN